MINIPTKFLSVIVPCYNEADCIIISLRKIIDYLSRKDFTYEIIVVDDGSVDNTKNLVEKFIKDNPGILIKLLSTEHKGKGYAVKTGMLNSSGEYTLFLDADLSTDITEFDKILPFIQQGVDVIIGSRRIKGSTIVRHQPFLREFMGRIFTWLSNLFLGTDYSDFTCGFKCFSKQAKEKIFTAQKIDGWSFDSEILYLAKKFNFKIKEIPVVWYNDPSTNVKLFKDTILSFFELLKVCFYHKVKEITVFFIVVLSILIGFVLRFGCIDFGLPSKNLALTTYNPDEPITFWSIEKWQPNKLDFHPHGGFFWGGLHIYVTAASVVIGKLVGYVNFGDREFYLNNLHEADKLYKVGRFTFILFGSLSIYLIYLIVKKCYGIYTGVISAFLLSILPSHVFNSIYIRPDILMMFFGLLSMYFSLEIIETSKFKYYILSSIFVGLSCATKYSGVVFGIFPIIAHFLSKENIRKKFIDYKLYLIPLFILVVFLLSSPYLIFDFNRTQDSFLYHIKSNISLAKNPMNFDQYILYGKSITSYIRYYLRYAVDDSVILYCIFGFIMMFINIFKNNYDLYFIIVGLFVLFVISNTKTQAVWYTFPFVPFCIIYTIRGIEILYVQKNFLFKMISLLLTIFLLSYTFIYTISYWKLYTQKNVREEASEWILANIPQGSKIAIARSYFWTPPVLRQYNPPYVVLMGTDPIKSSVYDGVLGLKNLLDEAEYIVLTEYEYRWAIHPKVKKYFQEHAEIIDRIFNSGEFIKVAEFDKQAKFLFFKFKKNYPPGDWLIPNPKIIVFKKVNTE